MTSQEFIFNTPLYQTISKSSIDDFDILCQYGKRIDGYNPTTQKDTTYICKQYLTQYHDLKDSGIAIVEYECSRHGSELCIMCYWNAEKETITKVGQCPSVADIHIGEIKKYKKILSDEKLKEFTRAIGLAANGVGIGSFVYLRRIFEFLVFEIANEAIESGEFKKQGFEKARMDDKIELLKDLLPPFLVANKSTYSILSVGIHELSEEQCLSYFDIMRVSIELILDERLEALQKAEKAKRASSAISAITSQIKAKK